MRQISILVLTVMAAATPVLAQTGHFKMRRAEHFYDQKNWPKAEEAFFENGDLPHADYNSGNVAFRQKRFEEAADFFRKAAEKTGNPTEKADAFFNLGNSFFQSGQLKEAEKAFETSLRHAPNRADAKKNLRIIKKKLNDPEPPPPPPPQNQPPPPLAVPQRRYLDRGQATAPEPAAGGLTPEQARQILEKTVVPDEQKNLRSNRALAPAGNSESGKKDW